MPRSVRTLEIERAYAVRLRALTDRVQALVVQQFGVVELDDLTASVQGFILRTVALIEAGQVQAQGLASAYVSALLVEEGGGPAPVAATRAMAGTTQDGRRLASAFGPPFAAGVYLTLRSGGNVTRALQAGRAVASRWAQTEVADAAARETLAASESVETLSGWTWVTSSSRPCGACLGQRDGRTRPARQAMGRHSGCSCIAAPVLADDPGSVRRETGRELFDAMTPEDQVATFRTAGAEKAELVRSGAIQLEDLVKVQKHEQWRPSITERPLADVVGT